MGGIAPIDPLNIMTYVDRRRLPCSHDEAIHVICGLDDEYRSLHSKEDG